VTRIVLRQAFAPVGTRLRKAAATEDGGEGAFGWHWSGMERHGAALAVWLRALATLLATVATDLAAGGRLCG
jgi:hypothetical protein